MNRPIPVLLEDVTAVYGIPAPTLRRWISEGRLTPLTRRPTRLDLEQTLELIQKIRPQSLLEKHN